MGTIPRDEKVFLGRDFNGHISKEADRYESVHGGLNESGEQLLQFAPAQALVIANSICNTLRIGWTFENTFNEKHEPKPTHGSVTATSISNKINVRLND